MLVSGRREPDKEIGEVEERSHELVRRSEDQQKIDVLRALKAGAWKKTQVMYRSNLPWSKTHQYLIELAAKGFVRLADDGRRLRGISRTPDLCYLQLALTFNGHQFLNDWDRVHGILAA